MREAAPSCEQREDDTEIMRALWIAFVKRGGGPSVKQRYHRSHWLRDDRCGAHWPSAGSGPVGDCECVSYFGEVASEVIRRYRAMQREEWRADPTPALAADMLRSAEGDLYRRRRGARGAVQRPELLKTGKAIYLALNGAVEKAILLQYADLAGRLTYFVGWPPVHQLALKRVAADVGEPEESLAPHFDAKRRIVEEHADRASPRNAMTCHAGLVLPWWQGRVVHPLEVHAERRHPVRVGADGVTPEVESVSAEDRDLTEYGDQERELDPRDPAHAELIELLITELAVRRRAADSWTRDDRITAVRACGQAGVVPEWIVEKAIRDEAILDLLEQALQDGLDADEVEEPAR